MNLTYAQGKRLTNFLNRMHNAHPEDQECITILKELVKDKVSSPITAELNDILHNVKELYEVVNGMDYDEYKQTVYIYTNTDVTHHIEYDMPNIKHAIVMDDSLRSGLHTPVYVNGQFLIKLPNDTVLSKYKFYENPK